MIVPITMMPTPNQIQLTSGLTLTCKVAVCVVDVVAGEHDVEVVGEAAPQRDFGRRLVFAAAEEPPRRIHLAERLAVLRTARPAP